MINAIYVTNNAYDAILLKNGTFLQVTAEVFADYINTEAINLDEWNGNELWDDWAADLETAAQGTGEIMAYYNTQNELIIVDKDLFEERREFFLGE
ncbi:hypothetical protein [Paenibacillus larvae]|uniref:Uncharacterized protein n=1 Tax=Paenibacillus larvae subsp. larvae TaxID=147375 RepID=A0A6C0QU68_9BACL|nr:hypothetical protein [Paenibacillus larvae]QHZ51210.1 hypothetical protein ERICV_02062 [Paenibacillus larvae subsp. larvae]QHZ52295.1 hypothetical protein ERICV_03183 [Paenibacillus larvae subsp. larvae]